MQCQARPACGHWVIGRSCHEGGTCSTKLNKGQQRSPKYEAAVCDGIKGTLYSHILLSVEEAANLLPVGSNLQAVISPCDYRSSAEVSYDHIAKMKCDANATRWM